jgi:hypothetical protein
MTSPPQSCDNVSIHDAPPLTEHLVWQLLQAPPSEGVRTRYVDQR